MLAGSGFRRVARLIAVLAVALLGSAATGTFAQAALSGQAVASAQIDPGLDSAIGALNAKARENWPDEFGEVWIKRDGPDAGVYIGFTVDPEAKVAALVAELDFPRPDILVPVTVKYSANELHQRLMEMVSDRDAAQKGLPPLAHVTDGRYDMFVDVENGVIVVRMPVFTGEFKAAFLAAYGDDLRFEEHELAVPLTGTKHGTKSTRATLNRRLRKVEQRLRKTTRKLKQAKIRHRKLKRRGTAPKSTVRRSHQRVQKLTRRVKKQRAQKRTLTRKIRRLA